VRPADIRAEFEAVAWESPAPHYRFKAIRRDGVQLRLVEFARGFVEHDWCEKRHVGYVLSGELQIELPEGTTRVREGQGIVLSGVNAKHKASAVSDTVTLFLVEDA
jgi:quercetin dioxygenase-like cupin family protein